MTVRRLLLLLALAIGVVVLLLVVIRNRFGDRTVADTRMVTTFTEVQENVRQAAYHLLRLARMSGGGGLPMVSGETWIAAQVRSNVSGVIDDELAGSVTALAGSDILTLRGFFEQQPFFISPGSGDLTLAGERGLIRVRKRSSGRLDLAAVPGTGSGIVLIGRGQYAVAEVAAVPAGPGWVNDTAEAIQSVAGQDIIDIGFTGGTLPWSRFNIDGIYQPPRFPVYQVGFLDSYTYFVDPQLRLMRIRGRSGGIPAPEPVAMHIAGLQVALAVDSNLDGQIEPT
jgi:hypothetical protein